MHFDADYREAVTLRDGSEVVLRLVCPADKDLFLAGWTGLSSESRYMRFFTTKSQLTDRELEYLTDVDQVRHFALGAVRVTEGGTEEGLGVARFVAFDDGDVAEPAIAVIDAMHGKGLGRLLFLRLIAAAGERGITQFRCEVLAGNKAMRDMLHHLAPDAVERRTGDQVVVRMPIPQLEANATIQSEAGRGPIYHLFSMVAEQLIQLRRALFGREPRRAPSILDAIGNTPLVPLSRVDPSGRVWVKCEHLNPGGSVKDRMALAIVEAAEKSGQLSPGATLIEATAGNTGAALAMIAAVRGYRVVCVMPEKMSLDKRRSLAAMGVEVVIAKNAPPGDPENFQEVARRLASEREGAVLTDQFNALANPAAHEASTGPEIWEQCGGDVGAFVAGVGTGGTITGVARFLKRKNAKIRIVLADPAGSRLAGLVNDGALGDDGRYLVEGIGSSEVPGVLDPDLIDFAETVSDEESFAMARRLVREEGLLVGGSAGTAVVAAIRVAERDDVEGRIVTLLPDHFDRYQTNIFAEE